MLIDKKTTKGSNVLSDVNSMAIYDVRQTYLGVCVIYRKIHRLTCIQTPVLYMK